MIWRAPIALVCILHSSEASQSDEGLDFGSTKHPLHAVASLLAASQHPSGLVLMSPLRIRVPSSNDGRTVRERRLRRQSNPIHRAGLTPMMTAESATATTLPAIEAMSISDFPILQTKFESGKPLTYLDSGASSQKPNQVLEAMNDYYLNDHANVHRGAHALAMRATEKYENARDEVRKFINAAVREEIVFTQGATDALNTVAMGWGQLLKPGDEIVLSVMEHHSNIVPWQLLKERQGVELKFAPLKEDETLDTEKLISMLSPKTKIVSIVHVSNTLGTLNPIKEIAKEAHKFDAVVVVDACQSVPHMPVDVQELDCDFLVASGHKMCGPTGIGFLYGRHEVLKKMPPVQGGGEMIDVVELEGSTYLPPPARFEAGTPPIAEAVGLGAACRYLSAIGMQRIYEHEKLLGNYLYKRLREIPGVRVYGPKPDEDSGSSRAALCAFNVKGIHASDISFFLDQEGIAVRAGHHCTQPLHKLLDAAGSCRASCYFYNSQEDVDRFIDGLQATVDFFTEPELSEEARNLFDGD